MGIEIRSTKEAGVAAKTGTMIGEAQRRAVEWEMQKATLRSQQEFQQELRDRQFQLDMVNRAREWEIEKMGMRSQMDFEREERFRQKKINDAEVALEAIRKRIQDGTVSEKDTWVQNQLFYYDIIAKTGEEPPMGLMERQSQPKEEDVFGQYIKQAMGGNNTVPTGTNQSTVAQSNEIYVINPQGNPEILPKDEWGEAKSLGYTLAPGQKLSGLPQNIQAMGKEELKKIGKEQETKLTEKFGLAAPIWEKGSLDYWLKTKGLKEYWRQ